MPVLIDISGIRVPEYCTAQVRSLYTMMGTEVIERAIDAMGATHYRTDIHNTQRNRWDIISDTLTGLNTGTSMVNSLDIQGLNEKVEQLRGVMRDLLARSLTHQAEQAFLGEEGAHLQLDGIAVLETHAYTINCLIDQERENTAHIQEGQLCHAYGLWMVAQIRHNLDQIQRGEVPDWINSTKLASLAGGSGTLDSRTLKGMTRVIPDCEVSEATGVGMVLLIPVVTPGSGPFPLFHIENIGVIRENTSFKYILAHDTAISRDGAVYGVPLAGCKRRVAITVCPHPLRRSETAECGFHRTQGCTLGIELTGLHFTRGGYGGRGQYCVSTLETSFGFNGLQCPIPHHEFCFTPRRPVTIGQAHISEVRRRDLESIQAADEFRNTLREYQEPEQAPIPHLAEVLREL
ncbi:hypothetical protein chiPu_0026453, partial [Chiloscyllium punctatum]|nr:hypothetical protein [Chiloscyllium punctatum]